MTINMLPKGDTSPFRTKEGAREISVLDSKPQEKVIQPLAIPGQKNFQPLVIFFYGRRGQGKTLAMTALAKLMWARYKSQKKHREIMTNYWTDFSRSDPYIIDRLNDFPAWARDGMLCIDEVSTAFPSARAMANINLLFTNFLTQIRKRDVEVMFTTQFPSTVSHGLLMQVDLFVLCEKVQGGRGVKLYCFDYWGQWSGKFWKKRWPPLKEEADWSWTLHNTDRIWNSYSTGEVIASMYSETRDDVIAENWDFGNPADELPNIDIVAGDGPVDLLIRQTLRTTNKIDPDGLWAAVSDNDLTAEVDSKAGLKVILTKHDLMPVTIEGKQWFVKEGSL
jgi:hypothetical protein